MSLSMTCGDNTSHELVQQERRTTEVATQTAGQEDKGAIVLEWTMGQSFAPHDRIVGRTPSDTVIYAIGDVHGCDDLLGTLLEGVVQDLKGRQARRKVVIFMGDYLSRGRRSREAVELVRTWRPGGIPELEIVTLKGNHEDIALRFIEGELEFGRTWLGGPDTMASYGVKPLDSSALDDEAVKELRRRFAEAIPPEHLAFLQSLKPSHREGGYHFVHAGVRPGVALSEQSDRDQMWIRNRFLESDADYGATVVHSHSIVSHPQLHANRIAIDTGAYQSGRLTCLVLEGDSRAFLQTRRVGAERDEQKLP